MSEDRDDLVLKILRRIQSDASDIRARQDEMIGRLAGIEREIVSLRRDQVEVMDRQLRMQGALDRIDQRVERIERRLDLADAPEPA